jgi:hypothetical protein
MLIPTAQAGGVIEDAPTFAEVLRNVFDFLLQVAGIIGIIGVVMVGLLFFFANGDNKRIAMAKKFSVALVIGFVILFGVWVLITTIGGFFL